MDYPVTEELINEGYQTNLPKLEERSVYRSHLNPRTLTWKIYFLITDKVENLKEKQNRLIELFSPLLLIKKICLQLNSWNKHLKNKN